MLEGRYANCERMTRRRLSVNVGSADPTYTAVPSHHFRASLGHVARADAGDRGTWRRCAWPWHPSSTSGLRTRPTQL